jgi:hypothetical protein
MTALNSVPWVELAVLAPGQSHYWFFDHPSDVHGWVFQATAHPEPVEEEHHLPTSRVEVTELFVLANAGEIRGSKRWDRVNITVTNCAEGWVPYSLWVVSVPPRKISYRGGR